MFLIQYKLYLPNILQDFAIYKVCFFHIGKKKSKNDRCKKFN